MSLFPIKNGELLITKLKVPILAEESQRPVIGRDIPGRMDRRVPVLTSIEAFLITVIQQGRSGIDWESLLVMDPYLLKHPSVVDFPEQFLHIFLPIPSTNVQLVVYIVV